MEGAGVVSWRGFYRGGFLFEIAVLRPPERSPWPSTLQMGQIDLEPVLDELRSTSYQRRAPLEEAPLKTDCLTSIHYIFQKACAYSFPLDFVGDMPRLLSQSDWTLQIIDSSDLSVGDLIFLKRRSERKLIAHAALVIGPGRVFHCKRDAGAVVESIEKVWEVYEQKLKKDQLKYIDPRNTVLRKQYGIYLP